MLTLVNQLYRYLVHRFIHKFFSSLPCFFFVLVINWVLLTCLKKRNELRLQRARVCCSLFKDQVIYFAFLPQKRWQPSRTAEPEVPAVHPLRHPPSARKSRWHPSLRLSPAEPCCLLLDGSIRCPTISGFIKSCTHFWT